MFDQAAMVPLSYYLTTLPHHVPQLLGAFLVYEFLFLVPAPVLSRLIVRHRYENLSKNARINWDMRIVAFFQAVFICWTALQVIWHDDERRETSREYRLWAYKPSSGKVQAYAGGYFLWDVLVSVQYFHLLGPSTLLHALCALGITLLGFRPFANYYGINFVLYELSTPFLNVHWFLDKLNMTGSNTQLVNGICLILSFAGSRLLWGSLQTWRLSKDIYGAWNTHWFYHHCNNGNTDVGCQAQEFPVYLVLVYLISNTLLSFLNFYWFSKMIDALQRRLVNGQKAGQQKTEKYQ